MARQNIRKGHDACSIANEIIVRCNERGKFIDPLKTIKLTYLCHGWMLGLYGEPLLKDEVKAWKHGPVLEGVYHMVKGRSRLERPFEDVSLPELGKEQSRLIDEVLDVYGDFSGVELSQIAHDSGTPWERVWNESGWDQAIPNEMIEEHFEELARSR